MARQERKLNIAFIIIQTVLYFSFLVLDLKGSSIALSSGIKYSVIILCFCYALFSKKDADKSILNIMRAAFLFTLVSDLFLLLLDYYFMGLLTFIIVQILYQIRISYTIYEDKNEKWKLILRRVMLILFLQSLMTLVICTILFVSGVSLEGLLIVSVLYFIGILTNTLGAIRLAAIKPRNSALVRFAVGMVLFLLCDINVGLFNLSGFITLSHRISELVYSLSSILMWTFYAPSQVMLALSIGTSPWYRHK